MQGVAAAVVLCAAAVACGGGADPESFAKDANAACRDLRRETAAIPELSPLAESVKAYERELERLKKLEPPDSARADYREMLGHKEDGLNSWREFARRADAGDAGAGEPALDRSVRSMVRAARIAGRLHLVDCDRALS
jgi:hypothetical protein